MFPLPETSEFNITPPNQSIITELFPTQVINIRPRIKNNTASASNINIDQNLLHVQVTEVTESLATKLGNENVAIVNGV